MQRLPPEVAKAVMGLKNQPDFDTLLDHFAKQLADADKANRTLEGPALQRSQGRAQVFAELVDILTTASKELEGIPPSAGRPGRRS